jgi:hypothetical protein
MSQCTQVWRGCCPKCARIWLGGKGPFEGRLAGPFQNAPTNFTGALRLFIDEISGEQCTRRSVFSIFEEFLVIKLSRPSFMEGHPQYLLPQS